ncbi:MAG TPA: YfhO family protein [Longimicrobiales bacterium]|nr:YfhO family protein [Longimicrobiales bacterium]
MSYVYAGHDGRIIVATLAPLFFFFLHRLVRTGRTGSFVGAAATLTFSLLSFQIQSNYYLLLGGLAWGIFALVQHRLRGRALAGRLAMGLGAVALAFVLNAVNFLPFLDYVDASPRGGEEGRGYEYAVSWSMDPAELSALAVPEATGVTVQDPRTGEALFPPYEGSNPFKLHTEYVGAFVLLLIAVGAWYARRDRYWWFFVGLAAFMLTISFGGHTPLYRLYFEVLPGTKRFRAPSISFFMVAMSLVTMAGLALERLAAIRSNEGPGARDSAADSARHRARSRRSGSGSGPGSEDPLTPARWIALGAGGLALLLLVLGGSGGGASGGQGAGMGFARFALFLAAAATVLWLWVTRRLRTPVVAAALCLIVVADLWIIDRRFFHTVSPPSVWFQADDVVDALQSQPEPGRAWVLSVPGVPSYGGTGNYLMLHDVEQAGGEHPNPLQRWYDFVGPGQQSYVDWHNFLDGQAAFLDAANVRWIVSMARLEDVPQFPSLRLIHGGPGALIYENTAAVPRAYLVDDVLVAAAEDGALEALRAPGFDPHRQAVVQEAPPLELEPGTGSPGAATILENTGDEVRITVRADRPALLVLAENYYDGWEATIDGDAAPVLRTNHTFRGVAVPAGDHEVVFRFRPSAMYLGFWIYLAGMIAIAGFGVWTLVRRLRPADEPRSPGSAAPAPAPANGG